MLDIPSPVNGLMSWIGCIQQYSAWLSLLFCEQQDVYAVVMLCEPTVMNS
jgi:hypothetical protein